MPLNLNKLDIKDYLYHAYGVRVISVRSYVQQQRVQQDKERAYDPKRNRWFRPRSIKKMTVQMDKGFVWPEEPTDFKPSVVAFVISLANLSSSLPSRNSPYIFPTASTSVPDKHTPPPLPHNPRRRLTTIGLELELESTDGTRTRTPWSRMPKTTRCRRACRTR